MSLPIHTYPPPFSCQVSPHHLSKGIHSVFRKEIAPLVRLVKKNREILTPGCALALLSKIDETAREEHRSIYFALRMEVRMIALDLTEAAKDPGSEFSDEEVSNLLSITELVAQYFASIPPSSQALIDEKLQLTGGE